MISNILWDVDGTLFDTYPAITYAFSKSLNGLGLSVALNVIDGLARESISYCVETLSQRYKLDPDLLRRHFAASYRTVNPAKQPPFPGIGEACELIQNRGGVNVIVTHRDVDSTERLLKTHALSVYFSDIFSVEQGYPRKPDPAMVVAALEKYVMDPTETLLIGDRGLDIQAGQAAGVQTCKFGCSSPSQPTDYQIHHYAELLNIIRGNNDS